MGDNELTSLPLWPHGLRGTWVRARTKELWLVAVSAHANKRISEHRDTISCHPLCCTNDLIDMKGRCCPKIVVSIPPSLFTSGKLRHIGGIVPKTALPLWRKVCEKREVDIISRYNRLINEELHRWSFDKPLKIVYHWYLKYLLTQTFFLVIAQWRFHSTWLTISFPKIRHKKNINWNSFPHFDTI